MDSSIRTLHLYFKQGDDFANHMAQEKTLSAALRRWGDQLKRGSEVCGRLAAAFEGKKISATADTHLVCFSAGDGEAERILATLTREEILEEI